MNRKHRKRKPRDRQLKVWVDEDLENQAIEYAEATGQAISRMACQALKEYLHYRLLEDSPPDLRSEGARRGG